MEQHSSRVSQMLEFNMNPVNAYLNTMHVKSDGMRSELEKLQIRVSELGGNIEGVSKKFQHCDERTQRRAGELGGRLEELERSTVEDRNRGAAESEKLVESINQLSSTLSTQLGDLEVAHRGTSEELRTMRKAEVAVLQQELTSLEQKVAK